MGCGGWEWPMLFISLRPWTFYLTFPSVRLFLFGKTILTSQVAYKIVWHNLFKADTEFPVKEYCKLYHRFYYLIQSLNKRAWEIYLIMMMTKSQKMLKFHSLIITVLTSSTHSSSSPENATFAFEFRLVQLALY